MIELGPIRKNQLAELMNVFPEVRWDRLSGNEERFVVFGWLDREDGRADFVNFIIEPQEAEGFIYQLYTSSCQRSKEFSDRLEALNGVPEEDREHNPCQRVEDLFGDLVPGSVKLAEEDPVELGGELVKTDGVITDISTDRAVLVDAIAVSLLRLSPKGEPAAAELAVGVLLEGGINNADPARRAKVLNLLGWPEVAGLIVELEALAEREGQGVVEELQAQIEKYRHGREREG